MQRKICEPGAVWLDRPLGRLPRMAYRRNMPSGNFNLLIFGFVDFSQLSPPLTSRSSSRRVLGFALADGPVLKPDIDEVDEDILGADARCLSEPLDQREPSEIACIR